MEGGGQSTLQPPDACCLPVPTHHIDHRLSLITVCELFKRGLSVPEERNNGCLPRDPISNHLAGSHLTLLCTRSGKSGGSNLTPQFPLEQEEAWYQGIVQHSPSSLISTQPRSCMPHIDVPKARRAMIVSTPMEKMDTSDMSVCWPILLPGARPGHYSYRSQWRDSSGAAACWSLSTLLLLLPLHPSSSSDRLGCMHGPASLYAGPGIVHIHTDPVVPQCAVHPSEKRPVPFSLYH